MPNTSSAALDMPNAYTLSVNSIVQDVLNEANTVLFSDSLQYPVEKSTLS